MAARPDERLREAPDRPGLLNEGFLSFRLEVVKVLRRRLTAAENLLAKRACSHDMPPENLAARLSGR